MPKYLIVGIALSLSMCFGTGEAFAQSGGILDSFSHIQSLRDTAGRQVAEGKSEAALSTYEQALELAKRHYGDDSLLVSELNLELGLLATQTFKLPLAERCFAETIRINPNSEVARVKLGEVLLLAGKAEEATRQAKSILEKHKDSLAARELLADGYSRLGNIGMANKQFYALAMAAQGQIVDDVRPVPITSAAQSAAAKTPAAKVKEEARKPEPQKKDSVETAPPKEKKPDNAAKRIVPEKKSASQKKDKDQEPPKAITGKESKQAKKVETKKAETKKMPVKKNQPKPAPGGSVVLTEDNYGGAVTRLKSKAELINLKGRKGASAQSESTLAEPAAAEATAPKPKPPEKSAPSPATELKAKPQVIKAPHKGGLVPPPPPVIPTLAAPPAGIVPPPPLVPAARPAAKPKSVEKPKPVETKEDKAPHGGSAASEDADFLLDWGKKK